jgi:pimeloyl-ACP methyl ester carboxylesterase
MVTTLKQVRHIAALLLLVASVIIAGAPKTAFAAAGNPSYCDPAVDRLTNQNIGTEVPVIMVHGFNGSYQDWGSISNNASFAGRVNDIPGVAVAHLFSYNTYNWVDDQNSGPKLAKTIDCISQLSVRNGGKGKVIVVGYSMGGLVARDALSHRSPDGSRAIADEAGQVITIGTPHIGTTLPLWGQLVPVPLWGAFTTGSPELERLPHFPSQTTVRTIAGDVTRVYYDRWGREVKREQPHDDTLVTTLSAGAEYTIDFNKGGGEKIISCDKRYSALPFFNQYVSYENAACQHEQLTHNPNNGVREDTIESIKKYVAWLNTPSEPTTKSLTIGSLTTTYDSRWKNADYGASGPGEDLNADDTTNGAACTNCTDTPPPTVYAFVQIFKMDWCTDTVANCLNSGGSLGPAPAVTVGGRTPDASARLQEFGYEGTALAWCFETDKICIHYRRAVDTPQLEPSAALLDLLNSATWSD